MSAGKPKTKEEFWAAFRARVKEVLPELRAAEARYRQFRQESAESHRHGIHETANPAPKKNRHRPKVDPVKLVMKEMLHTGETSPAKLAGMSHERMADVFDSDPRTCAKARREVLGEA